MPVISVVMFHTPPNIYKSTNNRAKVAIIIAFLIPTYEVTKLILNTDVNNEFAVLNYFIALVAFISFIISFHFFYPLILSISYLAKLLFNFKCNISDWQEATSKSLYMLPYLSLLGSTLWLVYTIGQFGGWPGDVIFGSLANILGAWCYLTIFYNWYKINQHNKSMNTDTF